jgi:predicted RND superfamily exporter protein
MNRVRWLLIALVCAGLGVYVVAGLSRITLDVDISRLLPPNMPETTAYRLLMENFSRRDELIVALEAPDPEKVEACVRQLAPALESRRDLVQRVRWQAPWENRVESMTEWAAWALLNQPREVLEGIEARLAPGEIDRTLEKSLDRLAASLTGEERLMGYDPFGLTDRLLGEARKLNPEASEFTSADGTFRVLYVRAPTRPRNYRETADWLARIREVAEPIAGPSGVTVRFTGEPAFLAEISSSMEFDMKLSATLTLLLSGVMVWLSFRSLRVVPALILTILVVFVLTLASSGVLLGSLTVLCVGFGAILSGLSAD